ncbi:MAG: nucleotidyl transferase AbiEii/AbiGii toxin family protein [Micropruina sp.]
MTRSEQVYRELARLARQDARASEEPIAFAEYLTRHFLESFLHRLTKTAHAHDFVLKGGILLAVYGARRPTKDVDSEAISANVTPAHLDQVTRDIAATLADDGVEFDAETINIQQIREAADYPGLRVRVQARLHTAKGAIVWDVSTGDPIVPAPRAVRVPRVLGEDIEILGYAPETAIAEKGVTILERGITSTRWRDYVDIVQLSRSQLIDPELLRASVEAVANHRGVIVEPVSHHLAGYGAIAQPRWAAWRRKAGLAATSEERLDDQVQLVAQLLDPVFGPADEPQTDTP